MPCTCSTRPRRPLWRIKRNGAGRAIGPRAGRSSLVPLHARAISMHTPHVFTSSYCQPSHLSRRATIPDLQTCIKLSPSIPRAHGRVSRGPTGLISVLSKHNFFLSNAPVPLHRPEPPTAPKHLFPHCLLFSVSRSDVLDLSSAPRKNGCCPRFASAQTRERCLAESVCSRIRDCNSFVEIIPRHVLVALQCTCMIARKSRGHYASLPHLHVAADPVSGIRLVSARLSSF